MTLTYRNGIFIFRCRFEDRHVPKEAGLKFDGSARHWCTDSPGVAAGLRYYADPFARKEIDRVLITVTPWTGGLCYPHDQEPLPFQEVAAEYALSRNRSYLALDPGLGKTIIAMLVANAYPHVRVVYVCPPFLALNTEAEFERWDHHCRAVEILKPKTPYRGAGFLIVPDSILDRLETGRVIHEHLSSESVGPTILFVDEAHRFKTETTNRSKALYAYGKLFDKVIFLSGTPMPNRPKELFPILSRFAPETIGFRNFFQYALRYCAAHKDDDGYWDFDGASNMRELAASVKEKFMLRIKKSEVLKELPPKTEELIFVEENLPPLVARLEREVLKFYSPDDLMGHLAPNGHVSTYRKELGAAKVKPSLPVIRSILDEGDESVLVFTAHRETNAALTKALAKYDPIVITGDTKKSERHELVATFQNDPKRRLAILNIQAAGLGLTLTKATRIVFVEFSWVPAENDQASDRAHRIGQTDQVHVQYIVFRNSIDKAVMESNLRKRKITEHI